MPSSGQGDNDNVPTFSATDFPSPNRATSVLKVSRDCDTVYGVLASEWRGIKMKPDEAFINEVRMHVMRVIVETGQAPRVAETASALGRTRDEVDAAHRSLAEGHVFVLE